MKVKCDYCGSHYELDKTNKCPYCSHRYNEQKSIIKICIFIVLFIPAMMIFGAIPEIVDRYFIHPQNYEPITILQVKQIIFVFAFVIFGGIYTAYNFYKFFKNRKDSEEHKY